MLHKQLLPLVTAVSLVLASVGSFAFLLPTGQSVESAPAQALFPSAIVKPSPNPSANRKPTSPDAEVFLADWEDTGLVRGAPHSSPAH
jgi:hypothetical protein